MRHSLSTLRVSFLVAVATAAAWAPPGGAATFPNLYSVTVTPDPTAADPREAAQQAAMARLLIRVTGNRNAPLDPAAEPLLASPGRFLSSSGDDRQGRALFGFSRGEVERTLTEAGLPVWGPERPLTVLWIAIDDGTGGRALLGAGETAEFGAPPTAATTELIKTVREEIVAAADERGLPIAWPLLDLQDLSAVSDTAVWGGFDAEIVAASARYRADAVLIGRVRPGTFGNEVDWLFVHGVDRQSLAVAGVRDGIDAAADRYAADLATVGGASVATLTVNGVRTPADYGRVVSYLEQQSVLQSVDVESFDDGTLRLRVAARGDALVLERVLALGGVLRPAVGGSQLGALTFDVARDGASP
jgi:hypothetical protein